MARKQESGTLHKKQIGIRFLLSCVTSSYPTVAIDEFLYYSLGRSIATAGRLLYRGQPAHYINFLYPLALTPVYLLFPAGTDFFRVIQFYNSLLINLAIFPLYGICKKMLSDSRRALGITAVSMLLPDFLLSGFIFSEALIYPLFFSMMYQVIHVLYDQKTSRYIRIGILGACLYFTKPGAVIPAVTALICFAGSGIRNRNTKEKTGALLGMVSLAGSFTLLWMIVRFVLGYSGSLLGVYDLQMDIEEDLHLPVFLRSLAFYPWYFSVGCGILPVAVLLNKWSFWSKEHRKYMTIGAISLGIVMAGTAWLINRREDTNVLFLRYMDMYIPLVLIGCFLPELKRTTAIEQKKRQEILPVLFLAYAAICTALGGSTAGIDAKVGDHYQLSVAFLCLDNVKMIGNIIIYAVCAVSVFCLFRKQWLRKAVSAACAVMVIFFAGNSIAGYSINKNNFLEYLGQEARDTEVSINAITSTVTAEIFFFTFTSPLDAALTRRAR